MVRFGILGAGNIAHKFAKAAAEVENAQVVAVASKSSERAAAFAREEHIPNHFGSYEEMLARKDINAVYIATTMNFHYENILQCLQAGKHVLCEKCMVLSSAQAKEVFTLAKERGLFVMECMWVRFLPKIAKAREWIASGAIGKVKLAQGNLGFRAPLDVTSRMYNPDLGGGAMYDLGVYVIEVLSSFAEMPLSQVQSTVIRASTGVDETVNFNLRYGDFLLNGQVSIAAALPEDGFLFGEEGYIAFPKLHIGDTVRLYGKDGQVVAEFVQEERNGFVYQIEEAVACIQSGRYESPTAPWVMTMECCHIFDQVLGV